MNDIEPRIIIGAIEVRRVPGGWRLWRVDDFGSEWVGRSIYTHQHEAMQAAKRLSMQKGLEYGKDGD
jgi:hypothetical protein